MKRRGISGSSLGWVAIVLAGAGLVQTARVQSAALPAQTARPAGTVQSAPDPAAATQRATLDKYCVRCHNQKLKTAGLALDTLDLQKVGASAEVWEKVVLKLRTRTMPPPGSPRPDVATYGTLAGWLETTLDREAALHPNPGRVPPVHRLNRAEYTNAIRDLLGLEIDGRALLTADEGNPQGFDNSASALSVSPLLLDRYLLAARKISRLAVGDASMLVPGFETYAIPRLFFQEDRASEDLPFGSRGGMAVRHYFPVDADYIVRIRLQRQIYDYILGLGAPSQLDVRVDGVRVKQFTVGGEDKGRPAPASFAGEVRGNTEWEDYISTADAHLEVRIPVQAGLRVVGVSFKKAAYEPDGVLQPRFLGRGYFLDELWDDLPGVGTVAIGGPYDVRGPGDTPSRRKIFICQPTGRADEAACARKILSSLARSAYRRPVTADDLTTLLKFYEEGGTVKSFEARIERALERILVDPEFLFRIERVPQGVAASANYQVSDLELASRLSFFLWSSIPDEELLDLAARGKLKDPAVLEAQVKRLLADGRSKALIDNFASQWLTLRTLRGLVPDTALFADFDENLREAFQQETELFLDSQIRDDRGIVELLNARYTFLNERLARHYGIPGVYGSHFRRVQLDGEQRAGLLGHGSILALTSYPNRTSPVMRGKWLLENVLGTPPPEPPANVPDLPERAEGGKAASVRERMELHRKSPACAVCHVTMDPLGFALENFDAVGKWRATDEAGAPVDTSSLLPDGTQIQGAKGLRELLSSHGEEFVSVVADKLLSYALGRGTEYYDRPAIRKVVRDAASNNHRWSSIVLGIVKSSPFQSRRSES